MPSDLQHVSTVLDILAERLFQWRPLGATSGEADCMLCQGRARYELGAAPTMHCGTCGSHDAVGVASQTGYLLGIDWDDLGHHE